MFYSSSRLAADRCGLAPAAWSPRKTRWWRGLDARGVRHGGCRRLGYRLGLLLWMLGGGGAFFGGGVRGRLGVRRTVVSGKGEWLSVGCVWVFVGYRACGNGLTFSPDTHIDLVCIVQIRPVSLHSAHMDTP